VTADAVLSRELKSLQEEFLAAQRERAAMPVATAPSAPTSAGGETAAASGPKSTDEQELRDQLRDLVKEVADFVDGAEKNISAHPAMSIVAAMLLGILIGNLLARR